MFVADCEPRCINEASVRATSNDLLVRAPSLWRFYDDHLDSVAQLEGRWSPVWRHAINPMTTPVLWFPGAQTASHWFAGGAAVSVGGTLAVFSDGGEPLHYFVSANTSGEPNRVGVVFEPLVGTSSDGRFIWVADTGPVLLDTTQLDRVLGPSVVFRDKPSVAWSRRSPAVFDDGSLVWNSGGQLRRTTADGAEAWSVPGSGVPLRGGDRVFFRGEGGAPFALDVASGTLAWSPQLPSDVGSALIPLAENETVGDPVPVVVSRPAGVELLLVDRFGAVTAGVGRADGGLPFTPAGVAQSATGELVVWSEEIGFRPDGGSSTSVLSLDGTSLRRRWSLEVDEFRTSAVFDADGQLVVLTNRGELQLFDRGGVLRRSTQTPGAITGELLSVAGHQVMVVTQVDTGLKPGERVWPGQRTYHRPDGGASAIEDYDCFGDSSVLCGLPLSGDVPTLYVVSAYDTR
ncbi:MAG: hypothetical protein U0228_11360 [Myxococcaceae bacterium]